MALHGLAHNLTRVMNLLDSGALRQVEASARLSQRHLGLGA